METERCCAVRESVAAEIAVLEIDVALESIQDSPPRVCQMYPY